MHRAAAIFLSFNIMILKFIMFFIILTTALQ